MIQEDLKLVLLIALVHLALSLLFTWKRLRHANDLILITQDSNRTLAYIMATLQIAAASSLAIAAAAHWYLLINLPAVLVLQLYLVHRWASSYPPAAPSRAESS